MEHQGGDAKFPNGTLLVGMYLTNHNRQKMQSMAQEYCGLRPADMSFERNHSTTSLGNVYILGGTEARNRVALILNDTPPLVRDLLLDTLAAPMQLVNQFGEPFSNYDGPRRYSLFHKQYPPPLTAA